jgi:hypothetical protein
MSRWPIEGPVDGGRGGPDGMNCGRAVLSGPLSPALAMRLAPAHIPPMPAISATSLTGGDLGKAETTILRGLT